MIIKNSKLYDILKYLAQVGLPALAAFLLSIGQVWHWGATEGIVATVVALDTLLGALLLVESAVHNSNYDGEVVIGENEGEDPRALVELNDHPKDNAHKKQLRLKVVDKRPK